jgi:hypothetical protein
MRKLGFRGVDYIIPGYVDVDENYATTEQVQEMYDYGWDICVHDSGNWRDDYDDVELLATQIKSVKEFIQSKGWNRNESNRHAAYPQGGWDDVVIGAMQAADMLTGRMIVNRTQANEIEDPLFLVRQSIIHTTSLETATGYIDRTIADGGAILLNFHKLEPTTVDIDTEILIETFEGIMDYLSQKREVIDVVTLTEWYRGITNARKSI